MKDGHFAAAFVCAAVLSLPPFSGARAEEAGPKSEMVSVLIKFMKEPGQTGNTRVQFVASSCKACVQVNDPEFERANERESVLYLQVPKSRYLDLTFVAPAALSRRVIINDTEMSVTRTDKSITISLPPLVEDAIWAPALETDIEEEGMVLRIEHADIVRRAGAYAEGSFPELQRKAADNVTFAMREVTRRLGLGRSVDQAKVGKIMIMGFDTNFPAGHTDAPPHVHMHLRWPNNIGTQIAHYYFNQDGLFTENKVGIRGLGAPQRTFALGETFQTIDNRGTTVYSHTLTKEGWMRIERPDGASCLLAPLGTGFQSGVTLDCGTLGKVDLTVVDDLIRGKLTVKTGEIEEVFRYDIDTGMLLSPSKAPITPPNARNPEW